jgi:hypothetical protein
MDTQAAPDLGCCHRVTFFDDDDFAHVSNMVEQLDADDCDNLDHVRNRAGI